MLKIRNTTLLFFKTRDSGANFYGSVALPDINQQKRPFSVFATRGYWCHRADDSLGDPLPKVHPGAFNDQTPEWKTPAGILLWDPGQSPPVRIPPGFGHPGQTPPCQTIPPVGGRVSMCSVYLCCY